jgi:epoxyqueuosine reductase
MMDKLESGLLMSAVSQRGLIEVAEAVAEIPGLGTVLACIALFPYKDSLGSLASEEDGPGGAIAPFAARNHYRILARLLAGVARSVKRASGVDARVICNSPYPEKPLAAVAGLGFIGRNGLLINGAYGSRCVIGALIVPLEGESPPPLSRNSASASAQNCGTCRACAAACPGGAILPDGRFDRTRCLQYWASRPELLPGEILSVWGNRIYGCEDCQTACPRNTGKGFEFSGLPPLGAQQGDLGSELPLRPLLESSDEEIRDRLRGSALGMSWIAPAAIRRNALLAVGNLGAKELFPLVRRYANSADLVLRQAAEYTLRH